MECVIQSTVHCIPRSWQCKIQACLVIGRKHSVKECTLCAHTLPLALGVEQRRNRSHVTHVMERMRAPARGNIKRGYTLQLHERHNIVQAQQLVSVAHGKVREIKTRADCAPNHGRSSGSSIARITTLHARAKPSARFDHMLQLVEVRRIKALAQHRRAHVTWCRGIELNYLKRRSGVVVPHFVAANAMKFADLGGQQRVNYGAAAGAGAAWRGNDVVAGVTEGAGEHEKSRVEWLAAHVRR